jgi:thioredoxin reductase
MATEGIFSSLRTTPNAELVADAVRLDKAGAIMVDEAFRASEAGLFAIGEARGGNTGTATEAIADGRALAMQLTRGLTSAAGSVQAG